MTTHRFFLFLLALGCFLGLASLSLFFQESRWPLIPEENLVASTSTTYLGPKKPVVGNPQLVRIMVLVRDALESSGVQIEQVRFNGTSVPLQPRDIYGNRGAASFQLPPGAYSLEWAVNRDRYAWPRTVAHEETVTVDPRDLWLQITVEGDTASIR